MASRRQPKIRTENSTNLGESEIGTVRIIGGNLRGRTLPFPTDPRTRPMKDRIREALFNLLGPAIQGTHAVDLFAGTGVLGFEALSRGADRATLIERYVPTAKLLRQNSRLLDVEDVCEIVSADAFVWSKRVSELGPEPGVIFCSPPYELYVSRQDDLFQMLKGFQGRLPAGSQIAVEFDEQFSPDLLPAPDAWQVRSYAEVHLAFWRTPVSN